MYTMYTKLCLVCLIVPYLHAVLSHPCSISEDQRTADCTYRHLTRVPLLSNLTEHLDLTGNNFTRLWNYSFDHLPLLRTLKLDSCNIDRMEGQVFGSLIYLESLSLSNNRINILHKRFGRLRFHNNPSLTNLDISFNTEAVLKQIESVYPHKVFASMTSLEQLTIDLLPNPVFKQGFRKMTNLTSLIFRDCTIMHLKNDTFRYFQNLTSLTSLEMSGCQVHIQPWFKVETAVLQYFSSLQILNLSRSMITFPVAMDILYGLTVTSNGKYSARKMKVLDLYNVNPLKLLWLYGVSYSVKVTKFMTRYLQQLCVEDFNIGKNGIVEIDVESVQEFRNINCLTRFVMRENNFILPFPKFLFIVVHFISHATNLQEFDYSYIAMQFSDVTNQSPGDLRSNENRYNGFSVMDTTHHLSVKEEDSRCMVPLASANLSVLRLSHLLFPFFFLCDVDVSMCPKLTHCDFSYTSISTMDFKVKGANLSYIDVSGIDFSTSGSRLLGSFIHVGHLAIRDANLDRAFSNNNYIFRNICHVEELDISSNHLNTLSDEALEGLESLRNINLALNFLEEFPHGIYKMTQLREIDLSYNKLSFFDKNTREWLDGRKEATGSNITVLLYGNPLACNCDTFDFVSWMMTTHNVRFDNSRNYNCTLKYGSTASIKHVYEHRDTYFADCNDHLFWLQFSISAISLLTLALVLAVIGHTFRWRILYFFYRNCKIKSGFEDTTSYSFDLFVAYTAADSPWIWQQLRPTMELQHSLHLCLHERNFEVGESISQNIVNCLQKSKKILFIISQDYINARWCDFELEMANMERVQRGGTNSIIVAIKGEIPVEDMPRPIRTIWQHVTCIIYPSDTTDRDALELFWCRLHHSVIS
ncbi:toll-like receptor 4 [Argopecten irradians]|uniref:toll-like receptor 4 n=1 Tax=Argopecten irradians TaxID=31199 RepID=UPI0037218A22